MKGNPFIFIAAFTLLFGQTLEAADTKPAAPPVETAPKTVDQTNVSKAENGFSAALWLTEDGKILEKWKKSKGKGKIDATNTVEKGQAVFAAVFFANPGKGKKKKSDVSYDIVVRKPDGTIHAEIRDAAGLRKRRWPGSKRVVAGPKIMEIVVNADDPTGRYTVEAAVRDNVRNTALNLFQHFDVPRYNVLPNYDFSYDYRAALKLEAQKKEEEKRKKLAEMFAPVEGVSLEKWAGINARTVLGENEDKILKAEKIKKSSWEKAEKTWEERMGQDRSMRLASIYSQYFLGAGIGKYPEAGRDVARALAENTQLKTDPPIPMEKWVEITQAITVGTQRGKKYDEIMKMFDMNPYDWSVVSNWWGKALVQKSLFAEYQELNNKYGKMYRERFKKKQ